ncbi:MAG TPA: hypothetical protein VI159_02250 [Gemmatimonadales bacterium]
MLSPEVEIIASTRRYILGSLGEQFGVWDKRDAAEPVGLFPGTDEGYGSAERLFEELRALDVRARGTTALALRTAVFAGTGLWIGSGLIEYVLSLMPGSPGTQTAFTDLRFTELLAYRVAASALLALAALALYRWERIGWSRSRPETNEPIEAPGSSDQRIPSSVRVLVWVLGIAAVTWIIAGVLAITAFRIDQAQVFLGNQSPSTADVAINGLEVTAYRVFLATVVTLLVIWAWPRVRPTRS